jgi:hypothetical protein
MILAIQFVYAVLCVGFALLNAKVIKDDHPVYHGVNFWCFHVPCAILMDMKLDNHWIFLAAPLIGRVAFDWPLNLFRGEPVDYVPENPKSLLDRMEKSVFGMDGCTPKIIYLLLLIPVNLILHNII